MSLAIVTQHTVCLYLFDTEEMSNYKNFVDEVNDAILIIRINYPFFYYELGQIFSMDTSIKNGGGNLYSKRISAEEQQQALLGKKKGNVYDCLNIHYHVV